MLGRTVYANEYAIIDAYPLWIFCKALDTKLVHIFLDLHVFVAQIVVYKVAFPLYQPCFSLARAAKYLGFLVYMIKR